MSYLLPFDPSIPRSQDFGASPGVGPNPPGGHNGDDWATPVGTPVRAAGDGEIIWAGQFDDTYADNFGWNLNYGGLMIVLNTDGAHGPYFEYGHLSRLLVKVGDRVVRGQVIALTGNSDGGTGVSTGPHCHVGALPPNFDLNTPTYGRVNPRRYMTEHWTGGLSAAGTTPMEETLAKLDAEDLKNIYHAVWFGVPGARLVPNEAGGNGEWPYTTLGSMTARISRDIVRPGLAGLNQARDAEATADAIIQALGDNLAADVVAAVGRKLAG